MIKTRTWVYIIVSILVLSAALSLWLFLRPAKGSTAQIIVDGALVRTVDLAALDGQTRFTVTTGAGENVILCEPGRIRVESADCPDQVCVRSGWLSGSSAPIVCLPHRLVIRLTGGQDLDTETG